MYRGISLKCAVQLPKFPRIPQQYCGTYESNLAFCVAVVTQDADETTHLVAASAFDLTADTGGLFSRHFTSLPYKGNAFLAMGVSIAFSLQSATIVERVGHLLSRKDGSLGNCSGQSISTPFQVRVEPLIEKARSIRTPPQSTR